MDIIKSIFQRKAVNKEKLVEFGFAKDKCGYNYATVLQGSGFLINVTVSERGEVGAEVIDPEFSNPYTLHLAEGAVGEFVGNVRAEYERLLTDIAESCFDTDVFKFRQTKELIEYAKAVYGDEPEYLWEKFPDNAVLRRKDTGKWYAALLTVQKRKLGLDSDETVEIIDLRIDKKYEESPVDDKIYFPGWHMNKNSWYTIILDNSVSNKELFLRTDKSYALAVK